MNVLGNQAAKSIISFTTEPAIYAEGVDRTVARPWGSTGFSKTNPFRPPPNRERASGTADGTIPTECSHVVIPLHERHLRGCARAMVAHYNRGRFLTRAWARPIPRSAGEELRPSLPCWATLIFSTVIPLWEPEFSGGGLITSTGLDRSPLSFESGSGFFCDDKHHDIPWEAMAREGREECAHVVIAEHTTLPDHNFFFFNAWTRISKKRDDHALQHQDRPPA